MCLNKTKNMELILNQSSIGKVFTRNKFNNKSTFKRYINTKTLFKSNNAVEVIGSRQYITIDIILEVNSVNPTKLSQLQNNSC